MYSPQVLKTITLQNLLAVLCALFLDTAALAKTPMSAMDVFKIAYASNPVISPDGETIAFHRYSMDIMTDQRKNDLWVIDSDGKNMRQISKDFDAVGRPLSRSLETPSHLSPLRETHPISTCSSWARLRDSNWVKVFQIRLI